MWNGKKKAITFSFDDGVEQDKRLIEIFNKYGLKSTFNLNSAKFGLKTEAQIGDVVRRDAIVRACDVKSVYEGHEVAAHTLTHPRLTLLDDETIAYQVERDRLTLSELVGYEVVGMAYPCGGVNNDERVADVIKRRTGVKYARTITETLDFLPRENLLRFDPSVYYANSDKMFEMGERFLTLKSDTPQIFYIWGHSYEMDAGLISWEKFEEFCRLVAGRDDIFYGTNKEVLLDSQ